MLTTIYPSTTKNPKPYFHLNYLCEYLKINETLKRFEKIRQIKKAFSKLENIEFEYKHPVNQNAEELPEHYKFHNKTLTKKNDEIKETEVEIKPNVDSTEREKAIDKTFNEDFDLDELLKEHKEPNPVEKNDVYDIPF
ncbi:hypothetical protein BPTFM16_02990 [Altererythrobacter insulae]|nr:hypothetical protein BPTFM16_02990 [Altererythrobacter insulae]